MMFTFFDSIAVVLLFYSFFPEKMATPLWQRVSGVPVSYIPFFVLFLILFVKETTHCLFKKRLIIYTSFIILLLFLLYIPFQVLGLVDRGKKIIMDNMLLDYMMFTFYAIVVFYGTSLYFYNRQDKLQALNRVIEHFMIAMVLICTITDFRFFLFDINNAKFYNLFTPLRWRFFEVFFLIVFATLSLGWYFSKRQKKYLLYFGILSLSIVLSGSRTAYVTYLLILMYLIFREKWRLLFSFKAVFMVIVVATGIIIGGAAVSKRITKLQSLDFLVTLNLLESAQKHEDKSRIALLLGSWELFQQYPFIGIGLGEKNLERYFPNHLVPFLKDREVRRPHNFYAYMLVATGLIGTTIILFFIFHIIFYGYATTKLKGLATPLKERSLHFVLVNVLLLVINMGYELETEPFLWMFWGLSISYFYYTRQAHMQMIEQA